MPESTPPKRLLLIDDDPAVGTFIGRVATQCGYDVQLTTTAAAFRAAYAAFQPDVIVLDVSMPETDGIELLRGLAAMKCTACILIVSGFHGGIVNAAYRLGAVHGLAMAGVVAKPVRADDLRRILERMR